MSDLGINADAVGLLVAFVLGGLLSSLALAHIVTGAVRSAAQDRKKFQRVCRYVDIHSESGRSCIPTSGMVNLISDLQK